MTVLQEGMETHTPADERRVLIIMTGGTICMVRSEFGYVPCTNLLERCLQPRPSFNDGSEPKYIDVAVDDETRVRKKSLRTPMSQFGRQTRYAVLEFSPLLDSSSMASPGWSEIALAVKRNYTLFDAFVVLHGTDSLAYTCSALSFMMSNLGKAVILTGSQTPMMELRNDGTDNLIGALVIAGHFIIPEVTLFFHNQLYRGNRATKVSATEVAAFASPNHPPLATYDVHARIHWERVLRPDTLAPLTVLSSFDSHAQVACLRIFPGISPAWVRGSLSGSPDVKGLILETFGAGNAPEDAALIACFADASERGLVIVNITQCLTGSVSPTYAAGTALSRAGVITGHDMTTEAALTKLTVLLSSRPQLDISTVRTLMSTSIRGELTALPAVPQFENPAAGMEAGLPQKAKDLAALGYAIAARDLPGVLRVLREAREFLLNEVDYAGKTPLHVASVVNSVPVLRTLLERGASVHVRTRGEGHTPVFLAAQAGLKGNVELLRQVGGHLHPDERGEAEMWRQRASNDIGESAAADCWRLALEG